jgi:hypothetical protein
MSEDPANHMLSAASSDSTGREHARRDALQEELLRRAYERSVHRSYIEAALRRAGHAFLPQEPGSVDPLRSSASD